jgi:hypothetical protein
MNGQEIIVNIEEEGIYYVYQLGEKMPEGRTVEVITGELKQIDKKFIPSDICSWTAMPDKPFGDELPITEFFSQEQTPNPVSIDGYLVGLTAYKVSDTLLTTEQFIKGINITTNGVTELLSSGTQTIFGDNAATMITLPSGYAYLTCYKKGRFFPIENSTGQWVDVPETGAYFVLPYGTPLPEGLTIEMNYIGTKKIEAKYLQLPITNNFTLRDDDFVEGYEEDDDFTMVFSNVKKAEELKSKILSDEIFYLKLSTGGNEYLNINFIHNGLG